jgi:hypothetical protein
MFSFIPPDFLHLMTPTIVFTVIGIPLALWFSTRLGNWLLKPLDGAPQPRTQFRIIDMLMLSFHFSMVLFVGFHMNQEDAPIFITLSLSLWRAGGGWACAG